jgi:ubiquinone/menaquinone biosynthesis C-methylase UbiE
MATATDGNTTPGTYYDGAPYALLLEPLTRGLHRLVAKQLESNARVLDAGCGTGGLSLTLAQQGFQVVGIDHSERQVALARRRAERRHLTSARFEAKDLRKLDHLADGSFDVAVMVMVLHEMPPHIRASVLAEVCRVARETIVIDFAVPLPRSPYGLVLRLIELGAGRRHFAGFRSFLRAGGAPTVASEAGCTVKRQGRVADGHLAIYTMNR